MPVFILLFAFIIAEARHVLRVQGKESRVGTAPHAP